MALRQDCAYGPLIVPDESSKAVWEGVVFMAEHGVPPHLLRRFVDLGRELVEVIDELGQLGVFAGSYSSILEAVDDAERLVKYND